MSVGSIYGGHRADLLVHYCWSNVNLYMTQPRAKELTKPSH